MFERETEKLNNVTLTNEKGIICVPVAGIYQWPNRPLIAKTLKAGVEVEVSTCKASGWYEVTDMSSKEKIGYCRSKCVKVLSLDKKDEGTAEASE